MNEIAINRLIHTFIGKYSVNDIKCMASRNIDLLSVFKQSNITEFNMIQLMNKVIQYRITMKEVLEYLSEHYISLKQLIVTDKAVYEWLERNINNLNNNI